LGSDRGASARVAILHDHLRFIGGGERVALSLAAALDADLYTTDVTPDLAARAGLPEARVVDLGPVPDTPLLRQSRQRAAFERVSLSKYDAYVLSGNWAVFAAARHRPNLWYCHTPVRVFYDLEETFLDSLGRGTRWAARRWIRSNRPAYETAVRRVDRIVSNSRNVSDRLARYLRRKSEVVHPPVDVAKYRFAGVGETWLAVARLSHEKRIDLLVEAFRRLPKERCVVAGGPQMGVDPRRFLRSVDPPANVEFLGEIPESELVERYATCRGLLATSRDEDFGITPVEAMASGKAVIAVDEGGFRETVVPGETGWLVPPDPQAIATAISAASPEILERMRSACEARARTFDVSVFAARMRAIVDETVRSPRPEVTSA